MNKIFLPALFALGLTAAAAELPLTPDAKGFPQGWKVYGKGPGIIRYENNLLRIVDTSDGKEWGISRQITVDQAGKYTITLDASCTVAGAQMVTVINKKVSRTSIPLTGAADKFQKTVFTADIPEGVNSFTFYIYSQYKPQADFIIRSVDFAPAK